MRLIIITFLLSVCFFVQAQTDFQWTKDLDLPYTDENGNALTGTEIIHLVNHKGKLYAGNSYWNEDTDPRRGQVWVKESFNTNWVRDYQMPFRNSRVPSLYSFTFSSNYLGESISPDTILFAGSTYDKGEGSNGPAVVFMRDDNANTWFSHQLGFTDHPFAYTQIRSMGFYRDKVTGVDLVFAGANPAPTGIYTGRYNIAIPGKIQWEVIPEFIPSGFQRIMGFAECNDTLYMTTQREIYKRIDGDNPDERWVQVFDIARPEIVDTYGADIHPLWLIEEDIRSFRAIQNPNGNDEVLMFGGVNHIFRLEPQNNYQLIAEIDIEDVLETATGHEFEYLQTQIIKDFTDPYTNESVQLIGFEAMYDTLYLQNNPQPNIGWFNQQGWYFERRHNGAEITYQLREILDFNIQQPDSLARVRTFEISPFPQDSGKVIYAGGFAPWFLDGVTNTAWIYKGSLSNTAVNGFTSFENINYVIGEPQHQLNLDLYVPNGGQALKPIIVYVHGGSWRKGNKTATGFKETFFTNQDYIFISLNYRLAPDPVNLETPNRIMYDDQANDIAKALSWIINNIENYGGDTSKLSLIGHSAGAHLVSLVATDETYLNQQNLTLAQIKCVCSLDAGAHDIPYYLDGYVREGSGQWLTYANVFSENRMEWVNASPITHLNPDKNIPDFMLVHQGTKQRVDLANNFGAALESNDIPTTYLNAHPLDHSQINQTLGNPDPLFRIYNDSVSFFFSNCLKTRLTTSTAQEIFLASNIEIYPNPTPNFITLQIIKTIDLREVSTSLYSLEGKLLQVLRPETHTVTFDLSKYPNGVYLLRMQHGSAVFGKKIIKY